MIYAVVNSKGGVAKSTTTANTGAALAAMGEKVLLIDLDPQASLTYGLGYQAHDLKETIYNALLGEKFTPIHRGEFDLIPSNLRLAEAEFRLFGRPGRELLLKKALKGVTEKYDFVLIDCPPSLGLLTTNALTCVDGGLVIPIQTEFLALQGLSALDYIQAEIKELLNPDLKIFGVLATRFDARKILNKDVLTAIQGDFKEAVFDTVIRDNVSLAESPAAGKTIFEYAPHSNGAEDYRCLAKEFLTRAKNGK